MSKKKRSKPRPVERPRPVAATAISPAPDRRSPFPWLRVLAVAEPLSIAVFYVFLLAQSWLRWMDPTIDFSRSLYIAWRLSEGDLLYRQEVIWYGPLPHLLQGAAFNLFGVGVDTMIWTNIVLTAAVVFLVRGIFRTLGNRWSGWLAAVVFLGVFAFGHYALLANFNFLAPYSPQATYGLAGLLLVLWSLVHHLKSENPRWLILAGLGLAVTYLDKPEPLLAALGSLGIYCVARIIRAARAQPSAVDWYGAGQWAWSASISLAKGFFGLWLPVFIYFLIRGGLHYAVLATDFVPYTVLSSRFRGTLTTTHMEQGFLGFDHPWANFVQQSWAGSWVVIICGVMAVAAWAWTRAPKFNARWWAALALAIAAGGVGEWLAEYRAGNWLEIGHALAFPVIASGTIAGVWSLWAVWKGKADWNRSLGLAVVGVAAALMLARMILNGRIYHFGFFMMPLAVLWVVHLMVVEAPRSAPGNLRANTLLPVVFSMLVLAGVGALLGISLRNYSQKNFEVGQGRDHLYTFAPETLKNGAILQVLMEAFNETTPRARTLAVFPEGIAVNYFLRVPTTLPELEFQPDELAYAGPANVLAELKAHPPESVIFHDRNFAEFNVPYFGADEASGRDLVLWINEHYWVRASAGQTLQTVTRHEIDVLKLRTPSSTGLELLRDGGLTQFDGKLPSVFLGDTDDAQAPDKQSPPNGLPSPEQLMKAPGQP